MPGVEAEKAGNKLGEEPDLLLE